MLLMVTVQLIIVSAIAQLSLIGISPCSGFETHPIIPAVERHGKLGYLFDNIASKVNHAGVLKHEIPEECIWKSDIIHTDYKSFLLRSAYDSVAQLGLSTNMQVAIFSGVIELTADGSFAKYDDEGANEVHGYIRGEVTVLETGFFMHCNKLNSSFIRRRIVDTNDSHVITGITSGYIFYIKFSGSSIEFSEQLKLQGMMSADLSTMKAMIGAKLGGTSSVATNKTKLTFQVSISGDILPPATILTTFEDVNDYVGNAVETMRNRTVGNFGRPLKYWLSPIDSFRSLFSASKVLHNSTLNEMRELEASTCLDSFKAFLETQRDILEAKRTLHSTSHCHTKQGSLILNTLSNCFENDFLSFKRLVAGHILSIRNGSINDSVDVCSNLPPYACGPAHARNILKNELLTYNYLIKCVKHFERFNISCVSGKDSQSTLPLRFHGLAVMMFLFNHSLITEPSSDFSMVSLNFLKFCSAGYNVTCKLMSCEEFSFLCRGTPTDFVLYVGGKYFVKNDSLPLYTFLQSHINETGPRVLASRLCSLAIENHFHTSVNYTRSIWWKNFRFWKENPSINDRVLEAMFQKAKSKVHRNYDSMAYNKEVY